MRLLLVAVGQRMPAWADAYQDFAKRFPPELRLELKAVKAETRGNKTAEQLMAAEAARIEALCRRAYAASCWTNAARRTTVELAGASSSGWAKVVMPR